MNSLLYVIFIGRSFIYSNVVVMSLNDTKYCIKSTKSQVAIYNLPYKAFVRSNNVFRLMRAFVV